MQEAQQEYHHECMKFVDDVLPMVSDDTEMQSLIKYPFREISFELPIRCADGRLKVYKAFRVQHNNARGPFKGGLRFHKDVSLEHFRDLAALMTWKTALLNLPFGGAKGGVNCDPLTMDASEVERVAKRFTEKIEPLIGPDLDVMAPDMGTGPQTMAWIFEIYSRTHGNEPAVVTGKPPELGGSALRLESTGLGIAHITSLMLGRLHRKMKETTVAIHGFGNVGINVAKHLEKSGARIIAVCDSHGGILCDQGLQISELIADFRSNLGPVRSSGRYQNISCEDLLKLDVDVLIPASIEGIIHLGNVHDLNCDIVIEGANLPITHDADKVLAERQIVVVPDILANGGGVTVSYLEWVHAREANLWDEGDHLRKLRDVLNTSFLAVVERAQEHVLTLREAAYMIALERVKRAIELRGT